MTRLITSIVLAAGVIVGAASPAALAQTNVPAAATATTLSESTVKALQDALNKQGVPVKTDGVLDDETRAAIRKYQSQHHLPVTGEADAATLGKLGVAAGLSTGPAQPGQAQAPSGQTPGSMMMNCPMMQGQMQAMMQMMQNMQGMMQMMQGQMQSRQMPGQMQPGQMQPGPMQPGPMQRGTTGSEPGKPN
jgi:hypothetical protein